MKNLKDFDRCLKPTQKDLIAMIHLRSRGYHVFHGDQRDALIALVSVCDFINRQGIALPEVIVLRMRAAKEAMNLP